MTSKQRLLMEKHGTPNQFARACERAIGEISVEEFHRAVTKYECEWARAGRAAESYVNSPVGKRGIAKTTKKIKRLISKLKNK